MAARDESRMTAEDESRVAVDRRTASW
jgi:hypothetical protein